MDQINPSASVQNITLENDALRFQVPFAMSITGPQQSINNKIFKLFLKYERNILKKITKPFIF
jgi:hypothetical protein